MTRAHVRLLGPCFKTGRVGRPVLPPQTGAGTALDAPRRQRQSGRGGQVRTTTHDRTLARGKSASYESHAGLFRFQDRRAVGLDTRTPHLSKETRARHRAFDRHPTGRDVLLGEKCVTPPARNPLPWTLRKSRRTGSRSLPNDSGRPVDDNLNLPVRPLGLHPFTPERFHVLLNSLFKVLFNFPSRYLFAIGLVVIFSLRWSLPPA